MLHIDKWCRISAIDCTMKDVFPPLYMIRNAGNCGRVGATRNMMSCLRHHHNNVTMAALATTAATMKATAGDDDDGDDVTNMTARRKRKTRKTTKTTARATDGVLGTSGDALELQGAYGSLRF